MMSGAEVIPLIERLVKNLAEKWQRNKELFFGSWFI